MNGQYSHSDYNASFVGFVPSRTPAVTIIVVTDSPHAGPTTGGAVSAPVFKRIAEATLQYLGIGPSIDPAPTVLVARHDGLETAPTELAGTAAPIVSLVADGASDSVPDVRGMSAREAVQMLVKVGMSARASGDGVVVSQEPEPGTALEQGGVCRLVLRRSSKPSDLAGHP